MNTLSHLTICSKSGLQISQSLQSLFCRFHTHGSLRICVCVCVCVAFFFNRKDSHGALAIKQLWHRVLNQELPRLTRSDRKGSTMFKRSSVAPSPCLRSFSPAPSGSAGRCGGGATPHRSWSRCRTPGQDLRSPGGLGVSKGCGMHIHQPSHLGHLRKGLQQQVSPTTSRIMRNNPTRPCLSL